MKWLGCLALFLILECQPGNSHRVIVFCASSCQPWAEACLQNLSPAQRQRVQVSFGATGTLVQQVLMGAPAQILISAHPAWTQRLMEQKPEYRSDVLFHNQLVLAGLSARGTNLASVLAQEPWAMGDPSYVPLGTYTDQALNRLGLDYRDWHPIATDSARSAVALLKSGQVNLAIIYRSDALAENLPILQTFQTDLHEPIQYELVCSSGDPDLEEWRQFFLKNKGLAKKFGFEE